MNKLIKTDPKLIDIFENISKEITFIDNIPELKSLRDTADGFEKAWKAHYKSSGDGFDLMFKGWEAKIRSERKMGEMLQNMDKQEGYRTPKGLRDETPLLEDLGITKIQSFRYQKLANVEEKYFEKKIIELFGSHREPTTSALLSKAHVSHNAGDNEWYTPSHIIEAVRDTMGEINLDPASSDKANEIVKAAKYYTVKDNGLTKKWYGNVWLNPPYSQPLIEDFCEYLVYSLSHGNVQQAMALVNNATETNWFQLLLKECNGVCFIKGRVKFLDKDGKPGSPLQGQAVLYFGNRVGLFDDNFNKLGTILWTEVK